MRRQFLREHPGIHQRGVVLVIIRYHPVIRTARASSPTIFARDGDRRTTRRGRERTERATDARPGRAGHRRRGRRASSTGEKSRVRRLRSIRRPIRQRSLRRLTRRDGEIFERARLLDGVRVRRRPRERRGDDRATEEIRGGDARSLAQSSILRRGLINRARVRIRDRRVSVSVESFVVFGVRLVRFLVDLEVLAVDAPSRAAEVVARLVPREGILHAPPDLVDAVEGERDDR